MNGLQRFLSIIGVIAIVIGAVVLFSYLSGNEFWRDLQGGARQGESRTNSARLTNDSVRRALERWDKVGTGNVTVHGIQEIPAENAAKATVTFRSLRYPNPMYGRSGPELNYKGQGVALFVRYNDGRWALNRVNIDDFNYSYWTFTDYFVDR